MNCHKLYFDINTSARHDLRLFSLIRYVIDAKPAQVDPMYCKVIHIAIFKITYLVYNIVKQNNKGQSTSCFNT